MCNQHKTVEVFTVTDNGTFDLFPVQLKCWLLKNIKRYKIKMFFTLRVYFGCSNVALG